MTDHLTKYRAEMARQAYNTVNDQIKEKGNISYANS